MKNIGKTTLFALFLVMSFCADAQVFWIEDYTSNCPSLCQLPYSGINGNWTWVSTGTNGPAANTWFVSEAESGLARGQCGTSGSDASLHVGSVASSPCAFFCPTGDCGAAYDACAVPPSVVTNARATSPIINCTGKSTITLDFNYIMNGETGHDYATVWYYDGSSWSNIASPPKTALCGKQGKWTNYSVPLPVSANNNSKVQIGFNWQNDANNSGNDPSFAVDSVTLSSVPVAPPVADFTCDDSTICVGDSVHFKDKATGNPTAWNWTFTGGSPPASVLQNPVVYYGAVGTYSVKEVVKNINGKDSITKVNYIHVLSAPKIIISGNLTLCAGDSTTLTASGGVSYKWNTGATTGTVNLKPPSTTSYTVAVSNGSCIKDTSVTVTVNPVPVVTINGTGVICAGFSDLITASGGVSYKWSNGATTSSINVSPLKDTTYSVTISNGTCSKDTSFSVIVNPLPVITLSGNTSLCAGDSTVITATGGGSYTWSNGATTGSIKVIPAKDSTLTLKVTNGGCSSDTSITITVNAKPVPMVGPTLTTCKGTPVQLSASGGTTYIWSPSSGLSDSAIANPTANPTANSTYTVVVANGGCTATDSETVIVDPVGAIAACCAATITKGQASSLSVIPVTNGDKYVWVPSAGVDCDTCPNTTASPTVTTWYHVIVTDSNNCTTEDSVLITVTENCGEVFVPDAFSPNDDGQNDVLFVKCNPACVSSFDFVIYDRWGNKIFETTDPTVGWDGRYSNKPMNSATYVYYLKYIDYKNSQVKAKGNITLVR